MPVENYIEKREQWICPSCNDTEMIDPAVSRDVKRRQHLGEHIDLCCQHCGTKLELLAGLTLHKVKPSPDPRFNRNGRRLS